LDASKKAEIVTPHENILVEARAFGKIYRRNLLSSLWSSEKHKATKHTYEEIERSLGSL